MKSALVYFKLPHRHRFSGVLALVAALSMVASAAADTTVSPAAATGLVSANSREMSLDECFALASQQNHRRPASRFALAAAEAQHRQALSGYWPQVTLKAGYELLDEYRDFLFPQSVMGIPPLTITTPPSTAFVTVPPGVLGPAAVQLPVGVPSQTITTSPQFFNVPAQDVKLGDRETVAGAVDLTWLIFDGGMRAGLKAQAQAGVDAYKQDVRRTDLEIAETVTRMYYGAVLARQLRQLGADTLERMDSTLHLTETMYREGGGKVNKSDYLANKVMVESLRAMVAYLEQNETMAQAALANCMGLPWQQSISPRDTDIPFDIFAGDLETIVGQAYEFSPDWLQLEAGLRAGAGAVENARSGFAPKLALTGTLHKIWNDYDAGYATARNKQGWTVGLGLSLPLFDGHLTSARVAAARARLNQLKEQRFMLQEGIGLQIKQTIVGLDTVQKAHAATLAARTAAEEDRDLNTRAYLDSLVETEKVIRSQLFEALMTAQHLKTRYEHAALRARLNLLVGSEIARRLQAASDPK